jgi:teichuronic acid exporter
MANIYSKQKIISGFIWKLLERGGTQGIQFFIQLVLARLLLPEEYGIVALITIFIAISDIFIKKGFNFALIQKKEVDQLDYSSVFYISAVASVFLYTLLFFSAPLIAAFYSESKLIGVIRVLSLSLFFGPINSVQMAIVSREMQFKKFFFSSFIAILISGVIGIILAYLGYGVWALVGQQLLNSLITTVVLCINIRWRPLFQFSFNKTKELFDFGWKLMVTSSLDVIYGNIYGLVIGKAYSSEMLGYYNRGDQFPKLLITNINNSIFSVMLPVFSANQDDKLVLKKMVKRSIVTSAYLIFPIMTCLIVVAEPLVTVLLTEKWVPSVPFLQIMCVSYLFWPISTANQQVVIALGRSDMILKLELINKFIGVIVLFFSIPFGIKVLVLSNVLVSFLSAAINAIPNKKLLNYSYIEQWLDVMPSVLISAILGLIIYSIRIFQFSSGLTLILQVVFGIVIYVLLSVIFKVESFKYLVKMLLKR